MSWAPTLPAAPSRPPVVGWFAYLTTQLVGIASGEAFGALRVAPSQYVGLTGIPSAQELGALALVYRQTVALSGIASAEAFGGSTFQPGAVNIGLQGIPSGQAVGTPTVTRGAVTVAPSGIASGEAFGTATVTTGPVDVALAGIASSETFGAPAVSYVVALTGIPSQASVGALSLAYAIFTTGIPTGEAFGTATVIGPPQPIQLAGIASAEAFGGSSVQPGAVTIGLQGIPTGEASGSPTVTTGSVNISLSGIPTGEAVGALNVQQTVALTGIASAGSVGSATVTQTFPQDVTLPSGIGSAEAVGALTVTRGPVDITSVGGIATAEAVGSMTVLPSQFVTDVGGIATEEAFGTATVVPPTPPYVKPTIIGSVVSATTATVTLPTHAIDDIIVLFAPRLSATLPSKPVAGGTVPAWVDIDAPAGANAVSNRTAYFVATATNHTSGSWTNAANMVAIVLRGQHSTPIGGHAVANNASAASAVAPSVTLSQTDGTSVILHFHYRGTAAFASGAGATPPTGYTRQATAASGQDCLNTKDVTTSDGSSSQVLSGSAGATANATIEIRAH